LIFKPTYLMQITFHSIVLTPMLQSFEDHTHILTSYKLDVYHPSWRMSTRYKSMLPLRGNQSHPTLFLVFYE
jgi:hypothetical protein